MAIPKPNYMARAYSTVVVLVFMQSVLLVLAFALPVVRLPISVYFNILFDIPQKSYFSLLLIILTQQFYKDSVQGLLGLGMGGEGNQNLNLNTT